MKLNWFKRGFLKFVSAIFFPVKIYGKENLPEGSAVVVSNHLSLVDCIYLAKLTAKEDYSILAKKEVVDNGFAGAVLKSYGALAIDRDNPDVKTLLSIIKKLKNGEKMIIFPEGTRNRTGTTELQAIKGGSIIFAVRAKRPIVPVMIYKKGKLFSKNKMIVGKPFELDEFYDKKCGEDDYELMAKIVFDRMVLEQKNLFELIGKKKRK